MGGIFWVALKLSSIPIISPAYFTEAMVTALVRLSWESYFRTPDLPERETLCLPASNLYPWINQVNFWYNWRFFKHKIALKLITQSSSEKFLKFPLVIHFWDCCHILHGNHYFIAINTQEKWNKELLDGEGKTARILEYFQFDSITFELHTVYARLFVTWTSKSFLLRVSKPVIRKNLSSFKSSIRLNMEIHSSHLYVQYLTILVQFRLL